MNTKHDAALMQAQELVEAERNKNLELFTERRKIQALLVDVKSSAMLLLNTQDAMEGSFTCLICLKLLENPSICVPCGHSFCSDCIEKSNLSKEILCPECGPSSDVETIAPNKLLDNLSGKFIYSRQVLSKLKNDVELQASIFSRISSRSLS